MHVLLKTVVLYALTAGIVFFRTIEMRAVRDSTSVFFNPKEGYQSRYSQFRRKQAAEFMSTYNNTETSGRPANSSTKKKLCVGIPSSRRRGARYVHETIGSLLDGLATKERDEMFLIVFILHLLNILSTVKLGYISSQTVFLRTTTRIAKKRMCA
jgi:hypothetical protein